MPEVGLAALGAVLLAIVMTWPLILHLGDTVPRDIGDPLAEAWQPAWGGHALLHQPLHFFDANRFWPLKDSLAFGDALIGYAPTGIIGSGPHAAMVRYDLLFLFAYALAFFGAYLLARELGLGPVGAVIAGAAFAYAPYRLEQDGHLQVISSGGIPLAFAFAVRGIRLKRPWWLFWAWLVAAWQVSIGWVLGLPFAYAIAGVRRDSSRRLARSPQADSSRGGWSWPSAAGAVVFIAVSYWIAHPYLYIADNFPAAKRSPHEVAAFSGPLKVFLTAPEENLIWGAATAGFRDSVTTWQEKTLFPGAAILVLAVVGLWSCSLGPSAGASAWGSATLAILVLELGFREEDGLLWPYRVLYDVLPGWDAIRTPGRLVDLLVAAPSPCSRRRASRRRSARPGAGDGPPGPRRRRRGAWTGDRHRGPEPAVRPVRQPGAAGRAAVRALDGGRAARRSSICRRSPRRRTARYQLRIHSRLPRHRQRPGEHQPGRGAEPGPRHGELPRRRDGSASCRSTACKTVILHTGLTVGHPRRRRRAQADHRAAAEALPAAGPPGAGRLRARSRRTPARGRARARARPAPSGPD